MTPLRAKSRLGAAVAAVALTGSVACRREVEPAPRRALEQRALSDLDRSLLAAISRAESAGAPSSVPEAALSHHDATLRRAAARAVARLADPKAIPVLEKRLGDEDDEVVAWAAHGLGLLTAGREPETVLALVARAASLDPTKTRSEGRFSLSAVDAIADALERAGTSEAEQTLRSWLDGPRGRAASAALALARLAARRGRLDDASSVALLDAASRPEPLDEALAAFGRLEALPEPTAKRLVDVARAAIARGGPARGFGVRALPAAGALALPMLEGVLVDAKASPSDRSAAANALSRLGPEARPVLGRALGTLVSGAGAFDERALAASFAPLVATLAALPTADVSPDALAKLATLPVPASESAALVRRIVALRCSAAAILAGTASQSARLAQCDGGAHGRAFALSTLRVLDRAPLTGARFDVWKTLADSKDPAVRRAALAQVALHPEMPSVTSLLVDALGAREPGLVVEAAHALSSVPRQATGIATPSNPRAENARDLPSPSELVVDALAKALDAGRPPDQLEPRIALARAAGALGILSLKPRVERLCHGEALAARRAAEIALRGLGSPAVTCEADRRSGARSDAPPPTRESRALTLTFVTDAGRLGLTLDPTLAPLAVSRIAELARAGFYDGQVIQRVAPGFVVQLGDPAGDGYTGSGRPPVPSETSPAFGGALSVGLAVSGRDTGSSQIFVTLADDPSLYGDYPWLGWADPEWATAAEGDVIRSVEIAK